jgi:hypothetical protein
VPKMTARPHGHEDEQDGGTRWARRERPVAVAACSGSPRRRQPLDGGDFKVSELLQLLPRDWPREFVQRTWREASVPMVTAHGLRRTHVTMATDAGLSGRAVVK